MPFVQAIAASAVRTSIAMLALFAAAIAVAVSAFGITIPGGIALYFVVWWTMLFVVLPFGAQSQAEAGDILAGSEPGAPARPGLRAKAIWTTILASVVFALVVALLPLAGL